MYYLYEGRTIRGFGYIGWSLLFETVVVVALGTSLAALSVLLGTALTAPGGLLGIVATAILFLCATDVVQLGVAIVFVLGFFEVYSGRHEYGLEETRSLERALIFLIVYALLCAVTLIYSATSILLPDLARQPAASILTGNILLAPLGAAFAGLTVLQVGRFAADPAIRSRLRLAFLLGLVGATVTPGMSLFATAGNPLSVDAIASGLIASGLAGYGISALSLLMFWWAYREMRGRLLAGIPAPVLPRIDQLYPWLYRPAYELPPTDPETPQGPRL